MTRRKAFFAAAAGLAAPIVLRAQGAGFPARPVKFIVPSAPGGVADILARIIAPKVGERLGQSIVVENRTGAAGTIGLNFVAHSPPDGYNIVFVSETHAAAETLYPKRGYVMLKDLMPVAASGNFPQILVVTKDLPVRTLRELIDYAKANPNKLSYGSGGVGNTYHMGMEMMDQMVGIQMQHVPFSTAGNARTDLIAGRIQLMFDSPASMEQHVRAGTVRALGISTAQRLPRLPEVPTIAEAGAPGYLFESWTGFMAPAGTPPEIIAKVNDAISFAVRDPAVVAQYETNSIIPKTATPQEFGVSVKQSIDRLAEVIRKGNIKLD